MVIEVSLTEENLKDCNFKAPVFDLYSRSKKIESASMPSFLLCPVPFSFPSPLLSFLSHLTPNTSSLLTMFDVLS